MIKYELKILKTGILGPVPLSLLRATTNKGHFVYHTAFENEISAILLQDFLDSRWSECPVDRIRDLKAFFLSESSTDLSICKETPEEMLIGTLRKFKFDTQQLRKLTYNHVYAQRDKYGIIDFNIH